MFFHSRVEQKWQQRTVNVIHIQLISWEKRRHPWSKAHTYWRWSVNIRTYTASVMHGYYWSTNQCALRGPSTNIKQIHTASIMAKSIPLTENKRPDGAYSSGPFNEIFYPLSHLPTHLPPNPRGPFHELVLTWSPVWTINHMHSKGWDEFTHPFPNFYGVTVEAWDG